MDLHRFDNSLTQLVRFFSDTDRMVAVHAIAASLPHVSPESLPHMLRELGPQDRSAAIVRAILESKYIDPITLVDHFFDDSTAEQKPWLLYLLGLLGEEACKHILEEHGEEGSRVAQNLTLLWNQHKMNWTNDFDIQDLLDFTIRQHIRGV